MKYGSNQASIESKIPMANPFNNVYEPNPFSDPSVLDATGATTDAVNIGAYDPYDGETLNAEEDYIPPRGNRSGDTRSGSSFERGSTSYGLPENDGVLVREAELARREAELELKERQLRDVEDGADPRPKNWPKCYPIIHHDIRGDIPTPGGRRMMRMAFALWLVFNVTLVSNFIMAIMQIVFTFVSCPDSARDLFHLSTDIGLSFVYMVIGLPVVFIMWYWPLYSAARLDRSFNFFLFFGTFFIFMCIIVFLCVGIPGFGGIGVLSCFNVFRCQNWYVFIVFGIQICEWILDFLYGLVLLKLAHGYYRGRGFTVSQAREQGIRFVSREVRTVAADAAIKGVAYAAQQYAEEE